MNRPYVNLKSKNISKELLNALNSNLQKFTSLDGVIGITLNGGLSRGYADDLSEIDIVIYLDKEHYDSWHRKKAPIALGIVKHDGYLYDIKPASYYDELTRQWDQVALWDLSYSKILYDPNRKLKRLFDEKLSNRPEAAEAEGLLFSSWWYFKLAGDIWIRRGDVLQGHFILNKAIVPLLEALFIANEEYIPHEKWIVHLSRSLAWKPGQWEEKLAHAFHTGDLSVDSLIARQNTISRIWNEIDSYLINKVGNDIKLNFSQRGYYELIKLLVEKGELPIRDWEEKSTVMALNYEPFYSLVDIKDDLIVIDREKLLSIKPEEMYYWMFDIVEQIAEEIRNKA